MQASPAPPSMAARARGDRACASPPGPGRDRTRAGGHRPGGDRSPDHARPRPRGAAGRRLARPRSDPWARAASTGPPGPPACPEPRHEPDGGTSRDGGRGAACTRQADAGCRRPGWSDPIGGPARSVRRPGQAACPIAGTSPFPPMSTCGIGGTGRASKGRAAARPRACPAGPRDAPCAHQGSDTEDVVWASACCRISERC